jgi:crossover junction endodeoxyribonuclease RuvC
MLILGIDPGLNVTGYGLVETRPDGFVLKTAGFIKTSASQGLPKRLNKIYESLSRLLDDCKPEAIVLEKLYAHYKHPVTAALLGHARGVICMLAEQKHVPFFEYPATRVKKITTGHGHASKLQIQRMVEHMLGAEKESLGPADTTDAISLAVAHAYISRADSLTQ